MLVGHLVGDFLLQTAWMADKKAEEWAPLLVHSLVYTLIIAVFTLPAGGLGIAAAAVIFIGHVIVDKRVLVSFWAEKVSRIPDHSWLKIIQDQVWHVVILALVTFI